MPLRHAAQLTRRRFLAAAGGATAGALVLGACGDDGGADADSAAPEAEGLALSQFFGGPMFVAGRAMRAPFGVQDIDGLLPVEQTPERLTVTLLDPAGDQVGDAVEVVRHAEGLPRAYFPLETTVDDPGIYTVRTEIDGAAVEMSLKVDAAEDVQVVQPGSRMPALQTPTTADARGVDPICTSEPPCPLHDVTVADAIAEGTPLALLVATPAFCQLAICGPVLDVLLAVAPEHPDIRFLHAEVYADPATSLTVQAPVVTDLGLHFEPCLVLVASDGTVAGRLDTIYDEAELARHLGRLA